MKHAASHVMDVSPPRPNDAKHEHPSAKEVAERGDLPRLAGDGTQRVVWIGVLALLLSLVTLGVAVGLYAGPG
jgi:hypothetical protein